MIINLVKTLDLLHIDGFIVGDIVKENIMFKKEDDQLTRLVLTGVGNAGEIGNELKITEMLNLPPDFIYLKITGNKIYNDERVDNWAIALCLFESEFEQDFGNDVYSIQGYHAEI